MASPAALNVREQRPDLGLREMPCSLQVHRDINNPEQPLALLPSVKPLLPLFAFLFGVN